MGSYDLNDFERTINSIGQSSFTNEKDRKNALSAARSLCHRLERPMETMLRIAWVEPAYVACLKIAIEIGVFRALAKGGRGSKHTLNDLAEVTNTDSAFLARILRILTSNDTIIEVDSGLFIATELSEALTQRPINASIDYRYLLSSPLFQSLPEFLKRNQYKQPTELLNSPYQYAFGTKLSCFEHIGNNPEFLEMFTNHMAGYTSQRGSWESVYPIQERILHGEDIQNTKDIILADLGGGSGHDLKRFASQFLPNLEEPRLVLQDLPEVIEQAEKSGLLPGVVKAIPIDFTKEPPVSGARAYYLHSVLHDWPDQDVQRILRQIHTTLSQQTEDGYVPKLLLNENVLPKQGVQPQPAALDMIMMAAFASHERSEEQWTRLLESSGYQVNAIYSRADVDESVIEAEAVP